MQDTIQRALEQCEKAFIQFKSDRNVHLALEHAAKIIATSLRNKGRVISCGNGGSMCDAMHFAEELTGRFRKNRKPLAAMSISEPGHLSCTANDFGYEAIFERFVEAHGREGDVLLAISTSGKSPNVLLAAKAAKQVGMKIVALTGKNDCALKEVSDIMIATPGLTEFADRVQELHIKCIHMLVELIEQALEVGS